jgi:DUF1009 family protein
MARIGLLAGQGELPVVFARKAKQKGDTVIAFALKGVTSEELSGYCDKMHWFEWGELKKAMLLAVTERIGKVTMLGKVKKEALFKDSGRFDEESREVVKKAGGKKDYAILKGVADLVKTIGIEVIDPTPYLEELIPQKGVLTKRNPTSSEKKDIDYGREVATALAKFDIGQTVVVKENTVIACEAAEGTDDTIKRAGALIDGGFTVVKMARPDQDARFDIPLVGPGTVAAVAAAKGAVLALEAQKTLLMDRDEAVRIADSSNISIVVV